MSQVFFEVNDMADLIEKCAYFLGIRPPSQTIQKTGSLLRTQRNLLINSICLQSEYIFAFYEKLTFWRL
jgi:hypothetical protein